MLQVCALTFSFSNEDVDKFYEEAQSIMDAWTVRDYVRMLNTNNMARKTKVAGNPAVRNRDICLRNKKKRAPKKGEKIFRSKEM